MQTLNRGELFPDPEIDVARHHVDPAIKQEQIDPPDVAARSTHESRLAVDRQARMMGAQRECVIVEGMAVVSPGPG